MDLEPRPEAGGRWLDTLAARAQRVVHPAVWSYLESGSYGEVTVREATRAWSEVRFRPRVLRGDLSPDLGTTLLGQPVSSPIGIAPTAMQRAIHVVGERATVAGAQAAGCLADQMSPARLNAASMSGQTFAAPTTSLKPDRCITACGCSRAPQKMAVRPAS